VLLDLETHLLLLGELSAEDLLEPDGVHAGFHSRHVDGARVARCPHGDLLIVSADRGLEAPGRGGIEVLYR
jgi:hypothetical protein